MTDRMQVKKLAASRIEIWSQIGDQEIFVSDVIDQASAPEAKMTVGFARVRKGESLEISFPYDEVLVITKGAYTVRAATGKSITAHAGEVIYLPAKSVNSSHAKRNTEMVYIANPPSVYADHVAASADVLDN
jgi:ethanolamine utilization protein EutQ (cupin superfamily)